jgi:hypothetical protein
MEELAARRKVLEELGYHVVAADDQRVVAARQKWYWDCFVTKLTTVVFVKRVERLDVQMMEEDRKRLEQEAKTIDTSLLPRGFQKGTGVFVCYLAGSVDPAVAALVQRKPATRWAYFYFPVVVDLGAQGAGYYCHETPAWGAIYYGKFRFLAERLAAPGTPGRSEPISAAGIVLIVIIVLMLLAPLLMIR